MHDGDGLYNLDARETRIDIRRRTVRGDPLEHVLDRAVVFNSLAVTGDGRGRIKGGAHQFSIARASPRDVAMHGAGDGVVLREIGVAGGLDWREALDFIDRQIGRTLGA
jgi:hypothetical protein